MNLHVENGRHRQVPHDEDHDISGKIICAVVKQFLTANVASIVHLEEGAKHPPFAAARAPAKKTPSQGGHWRLRGPGIGHDH